MTDSVAKNAYKPCVIIPCYNHGDQVESVLQRLATFSLPILIIDDGSDQQTAFALKSLVQEYPEVTLHRLPQNKGKGGAVLAGMALAQKFGYTHAVQIDADGQHSIEDTPLLLEKSRCYPRALISGQPIYDASVPKSRLYGRYVTHFWVWVETLSLSIKDSMCGFRIYPILSVMQLLERGVHIGRRMDFDTEIMVRLYWEGVLSLFVPTRVVYPQDGLSHFDVVKDNIRISWMHTRLFFGMLPRIPRLLKFSFQAKQMREQAKQPAGSEHWAEISERRGMSGMRFMFWVYRIFGRRLFKALLYPVVALFYLTGRQQRIASQQFLERAKAKALTEGVAWDEQVNSYQHMLRFADAMLDKLASWQGDIRWGKEIDWAKDTPIQPDFKNTSGCFFLVSHLGDVEVCRALAQQLVNFKINALVFNKNAQRFKQMMDEFAPDASLNLIMVDEVGPQTAALLQDKIAQGENVAIVGDRISISQNMNTREARVIWSDFLGAPAPFAQGPFILASLLKCPVYLMFGLKKQGSIHVYCEHFRDQVFLPRKSRQEALQQTVDAFANRLEYYSIRYPLEWFNFFDFWQLPKDAGRADE